MDRNKTLALLERAEKLFDQEEKLVQLDSGKVIFVGDTHGDIDATRKVVSRYLKDDNTIVFLGDYVDRGSASVENINTLLELKIEHPHNLFLLMGNHEGFAALDFRPADFWDSLDAEMRQRYASVLARLPLAASTSNGIVALHGALPDVPTPEDIGRIKLGSREWLAVTWGDWQESPAAEIGESPSTGRPQFGEVWFTGIMDRWGKNVLVRSHQPGIRPVVFRRRCLTIFTSDAYPSYASGRTVAIADTSREVKTVDDLRIEVI